MLHVAIIGKDSYIGGKIKERLIQCGHDVVEVDALEDKWQEFNFLNIDTVIQVAAIVHRKDITDYQIYERINVELPINVAKKAKLAGVKQFIFLSSMAVYGKGRSLKNCKVSPEDMLCAEKSYAKSKLEAERRLSELAEENFKLAIVRPPSVYGKGCRGDLFDKYIKIACKLSKIPNCEKNVFQGMVHIDNLTQCIQIIAEEGRTGTFHPQDKELLTSSQLLYQIRIYKGKKAKLSTFLGKIIKVIAFTSVYKKLFGGVYYSEGFDNIENISQRFISTAEGLKRSLNE